MLVISRRAAAPRTSPGRVPGQGIELALTAARNAAHSAQEKIRTGPGRLESRTTTRPADSRAVSTQLPLGLL